MTGLSLFSGIGGMDLAFEAAGGRVIAMCECEPFCRQVLKKHWPDVPIFEDVKTLRGEDIATPVDVIFGGPPCQPVSVAGRRRGRDDERYLWGDVFRLVSEIMPRFCVFENVPGILSISADEICSELERIGYSVGICCFEAAVVGAWHRRMRVFFVAHSKGGRFEPRFGERNRDSETHNKKANDPASRSDKPSSAVPHPRCRMFERSSVDGTICGEPEKWPSSDTERSGSSSVPNADGGGFKPRGAEFAGQFGQVAFIGSSAQIRESYVTKSKCMRELQQKRGFEEIGERIGNGCGNVADADLQRCEEQRRSVTEGTELGRVERGGWQEPESGMGGVVNGLSAWAYGYWRVEPDIPRTARGIPNRVARLKALGNAVVPAQIYPLFKAIMEVEDDSQSIPAKD